MGYTKNSVTDEFVGESPHSHVVARDRPFVGKVVDIADHDDNAIVWVAGQR